MYQLEAIHPNFGKRTLVGTSTERERWPWERGYWRWRALWVVVSVAIVAVGYAVAQWVIDKKDPGLVVGPEFTIFAFLYIAAQAIERGLEPISILLPGPKEDKEKAATAEKEAKDEATGIMAETITSAEDFRKKMEPVQDKLDEAAQAKESAETKRVFRMMIFWGSASALGFLISSYLGLYLLSSVTAAAAEGTTAAKPELWLDILVSGLAIGGGTKPLHDLIGRIEKAKEKDEEKDESPPTTVVTAA